jgi:hypothetical protein
MKVPYALIDGEICIQVRASAIPTACFYTDGFRFRRAPKGGHHYITLADAIAWHENELALAKRKERGLKALTMLRDARDRVNGELRIEQMLAERAKARAEMRAE